MATTTMTTSAMAFLVFLLVAILSPTTLASRSGPASSHHGHGHAKRSPPPSPSLPPPAAPTVAPPQAPAAAPSLVRATCNSTAYYATCVSALAADPTSGTADVRGLSAIAVSAAAANASGAATDAAVLANATTGAALSDGAVQALLRTCAAKYGEARDALGAARTSIAAQDFDYASVYVAAAAEYPQVCKALFRRQRPAAYPAELAAREEALKQLCSVALDIISLLNTGNPSP